MKTKINVSDMKLSGKEFVVTFNSTYHLPIEWLVEDENGNITVDSKDKFNLNRLIIAYFRNQMFNDSFGKIAAESFSLVELTGYENIQKELNSLIKQTLIEKEKKNAV